MHCREPGSELASNPGFPFRLCLTALNGKPGIEARSDL